jgi:DivIVA domain-containing protein
MDVTPQELRSSEIKDSWRGYDRDEVDDLLERAAVTIEGLTQQLQETHSRPAAAAASAPAAPVEVPLPSSRDDADMLQRTLLLAQRAADDAVNEAQTRAKQILEESETKAQSLVSDAEATARRIAEGERRRLETEILELSDRREKLRIDADALEEYVSGYRDRIRAAVEADLANLSGDVEPPTARPELHEVELPPERESAPTANIIEPAPDSSPSPSGPSGASGTATWDDGPSTRSIDAVDPPAGEAAPFVDAQRSPVAAPPRPEPAADWPPAPEASAAPAAAGESSWLSNDAEWGTAATAWDAPAPWERDQAANPAPEPAPADIPIEATSVDTDALDDDAFFASLREAVRDDAPLGPRDDEQTAFFDPNADDDRRRFRRRR